jgi:hypothetical protein
MRYAAVPTCDACSADAFGAFRLACRAAAPAEGFSDLPRPPKLQGVYRERCLRKRLNDFSKTHAEGMEALATHNFDPVAHSIECERQIIEAQKAVSESQARLTPARRAPATRKPCSRKQRHE